MKYRKDRQDFAGSRPLPPFGAFVKWTIDLLQLTDPESYESCPVTPKELTNAQDTLACSTAKNLFAGIIVKEESKNRTCAALAVCLRALRGLPFGSVSLEDLSQAIRALWTAYERVSGKLSSIPKARERVSRCLFRHATVELAIRAGAMAAICNDHEPKEELPLWSRESDLRTHLRNLLKLVGSRDVAARKLGKSPSEVDRWVDELDVPAPGDTWRWERLLHSSANGQSIGARHLWRMCVGRRLWNSIAARIPADLRDELLQAFCRIKHRVYAFLILERRGSEEQRRQQAVFLAITGRIPEKLLAYQIVKGEADVLWRWQFEAAFRINGVPTTGIVHLCQIGADMAARLEESSRAKNAPSQDEFVREYLSKAEWGGSPSAEYARLLERAGKHESSGEINSAAACVEQLVRLAPAEPGSWYALGRIRRMQQRRADAERCFRKVLQIDPRATDARIALAVLLVMSRRTTEAREELERCVADEKQRVEWRFAQGLVFFFSERPDTAKDELLKCAKEGFVPSVCYQFIAFACEMLRQDEEAREYRKRVAELGVVV